MKKLRDLRERKDLKQNEVARDLNIPNTTYSNYENGFRSPDYQTLLKIANYFNVSIDYLLETNINDKKFIIELSEEEYNRLKDILDKIDHQINNQRINIKESNIIKGNSNSINIENSYNKNISKKKE